MRWQDRALHCSASRGKNSDILETNLIPCSSACLRLSLDDSASIRRMRSESDSSCWIFSWLSYRFIPKSPAAAAGPGVSIFPTVICMHEQHDRSKTTLINHEKSLEIWYFYWFFMIYQSMHEISSFIILNTSRHRCIHSTVKRRAQIIAHNSKTRILRCWQWCKPKRPQTKTATKR